MIFTNNQKRIVTQVPIPNSYSSAFSSRYMRAHPPINPAPVLRTPSLSYDGKPYNTASVTPFMGNPQTPTPTPKSGVFAKANVSRNVLARQNETPKEIETTDTYKKTMKWGEPTWFMFHTIAEKIKPEQYAQYRGELLNIIQTISSTLPCPICATHATQYTKNITEAQIATKTDFQNMLWSFHNSVNQRKGLPIFPYEQLHVKYSKANTRMVIQRFIEVHSDKHAGFRMIADDFYRNRITNFLRSWFLNNIHVFAE